MKKINLLLIGTILISVQAVAQHDLKKVEGKNIYTEEDVYVSDNGEYFAKTFYIAFNKHVTKDIHQTRNIGSSNIRCEFAGLKDIFSELENHYGLQKMERAYPEAVPNDTIRYSNKGKRVVVSDLSKRYKLIFNELQSYEILKQRINAKEIRYVEPPIIHYMTSNYPNDPYYDLQWTLKLLEAEKVFDITKGSEDIILGISDKWISSNTHGVHEELEGRIPTYQATNSGKWVPGAAPCCDYDHGPRIALIAAAKNNNSKGISSLGGSFQVIPAKQSAGLPYFINLSESLRPDVINMSWTTWNYQSVKNNVEALLSLGVVMVGASVNDVWDQVWPGQTTLGEPFIPYPASYNFPDSSFQVISVSATQLTDDVGTLDVTQPIDPFQYEERFTFQSLGTPNEYIFNYGLSNNPVVNPFEAFTDIAAPSMRIFTAAGETATNDYKPKWGATSEAAPLVTSVVGMMLSVNPNLGVREVYDIITSTTDYDNIVVPPGSSTFYHPDGIRKYNKYIGYGRINAYKAVLASVPKITTDVTSNET